MIDSPYVAKRVQAGIPLWDILVRGEEVGSLSNLPMEDSPMATVRYFGHEETFAADTIHGVLALVGDHLASFDSALDPGQVLLGDRRQLSGAENGVAIPRPFEGLDGTFQVGCVAGLLAKQEHRRA